MGGELFCYAHGQAAGGWDFGAGVLPIWATGCLSCWCGAGSVGMAGLGCRTCTGRRCLTCLLRHSPGLVELLEPLLTEEERDVYRRGRNAHLHAIPKHATAKEYARATGLECLFGQLFLEGKTERINQLFVTVMEALYGI